MLLRDPLSYGNYDNSSEIHGFSILLAGNRVLKPPQTSPNTSLFITSTLGSADHQNLLIFGSSSFDIRTVLSDATSAVQNKEHMKEEEKELFAAIEAGDAAKVTELIKSGIDINCHDAGGMSPLSTAAYK
ncbi:unnamed protein product [Strongylus vulgaris]|uniref:Uncharacterized protein n=1 Tax=Strongylus vulgaris TaxID=40348 RepID=A0A3P7J6J8_STRVU|nr:unnamed protein product [Strongylus vulgaris]